MQPYKEGDILDFPEDKVRLEVIDTVTIVRRNDSKILRVLYNDKVCIVKVS